MGTNAGTRRNRFTGRAAAAGLLLAAAVIPAGAGTSAAASGTGFGPHAGRFQDSNWGGYVATGSFSTISGSWTEPHVTCNSSSDLFAPWIGLDGYGSQTVEQTGVQTDCSSGSPVLSAWYEMYPAAPVYWNDPVSEGDSITASVVSNGGGSYTLTLTDNTKGWTEHVDKDLAAENVSAEAVIESPTQSYPSFSQLDFSGVTVDGQSLDATNPQAFTSGGYAPGPLSGGSFSMTPSGAAARTPHAPAKRPSVIRY
ncbi:G1 family glutamic endopeptidase [Streptantibioticus rubrisoli]|uniref:G1 family endopeptidase n=1 Tax=Streptantibioticus rubrisoli TaxID=1387313 RepID=A0ABT1P5H5_9ACTN|nr:G1 family glutamic endopeptidase [Streptantibioticus rubrisoli]MCQ4040619.1 G1 family endopeptidase [Streptantibioticus rubrisoli]